MLDLALVGTGGMLPLPKRWLSAVLIRYGSHLILFDCGEATQVSLRQLGWGLKDMDLILISHVHGDHVLGLPGLLLTQGNSGRTAPLLIVGPPGIARVLSALRVAAPYLPFEVRCLEFQQGNQISLDELGVSCTEALHHVPCLAYRLELPRAPRFLPDRARALGVPAQDWKRLQRGESVGDVQPTDVLGPPRRGLAVGLVTDTRPTPEIAELVHGVDTLVCEATFGADEDQPRAVERRHMTFREAAGLAQTAQARQLVLTHFSAGLTEPQVFIGNATDVFPNTIVGRDHLTLNLRFAEE